MELPDRRLWHSAEWEFDGTKPRPMGTPIGKTTDGSVLGAQTAGKPIGKTTHRWPGVPNTRTRTHGETHIEERERSGTRDPVHPV